MYNLKRLTLFFFVFIYGSIKSEIDLSAWDNHKIIGYITKSLSKTLTNEHLLNKPLVLSNRLLLYGPPGNGKTTLAHEIARTSNCEFVHIRASSLVTKYQGSGAENIQSELIKAFEKILTSNRPVVVFIDEIDAIASIGSDGSSRVEYNNATQELWQFLDTCKNDPRIFIICATNHYEKLNVTLVSRFPEQQRIKIDQPNEFIRENVLVKLMKNHNFMMYHGIVRDLAQHSNGMSIRELESFIYEIRLHAEFEQSPLTNTEVIEKLKTYLRGYNDSNDNFKRSSRRDIYDKISLISTVLSILNMARVLAESDLASSLKNYIYPSNLK